MIFTRIQLIWYLYDSILTERQIEIEFFFMALLARGQIHSLQLVWKAKINIFRFRKTIVVLACSKLGMNHVALDEPSTNANADRQTKRIAEKKRTE